MKRRDFVIGSTSFLVLGGCAPGEEPSAGSGEGLTIAPSVAPEPRPPAIVTVPESTRAVQRTVAAVRQREGAGFIVRRPFPSRELDLVDPFVLLDEVGPIEYGPGEAVGAPDHPHRGFETVTYLIEGQVRHRDSMGHDGTLGNEGVQWMTAGRGIVHSEMPSDETVERGGRAHGFQLWVNLPAELKMMEPSYKELPDGTIPRLETPDGLATARIIAGSALGVAGQIATTTPVTYHHWTLRPGAVVDFPVPARQQVSAFVFSGNALLGTAGTVVSDGTLATFGAGEMIRLAAAPSALAPTELLLLAGEPLNEPIARYGPFVMNTDAEIRQAFTDYRNGKMGRIPPV